MDPASGHVPSRVTSLTVAPDLVLPLRIWSAREPRAAIAISATMMMYSVMPWPLSFFRFFRTFSMIRSPLWTGHRDGAPTSTENFRVVKSGFISVLYPSDERMSVIWTGRLVG